MRMYFLVMYNLSGIQKGIQAGHAALEYAYEYAGTNDYQDFITKNKTWIILDGGGSIEMENHRKTLYGAGIKNTIFREPDLNNAISAIAFLVPERVYNPQPNEGLLGVWELSSEYSSAPKIGTDEWFTAYLKGFHLARN